MEWFNTAVLASMWDEDAKQRIAEERSWFNMMNPQDSSNIIQNSNPIENSSSMTDIEKQAFIDSLSDYQYHQMQNYKKQGYSFEAAKALIESKQADSTSGEDSNVWVNIAQSIIDVPLDLVKFPFRMIDKGMAWVAKWFSDNDEAIDQQLEENLKKIEDFWTLPWVNREDASYFITNFVADLWATIASSFIPLVWAEKWAAWIEKYPRLVKWINNARWMWEVAEKSPWLARFLKWGSIWVKDTVLMNALEWEWTTPLEAAEWWLVWGMFEKWSQALKKIGAYIWTNWLITQAEAENIIKLMKHAWVDVKWDSVESIAEFLTKYWLTWSREQIIQKSRQLWQEQKKILDAIITKIDEKLWAVHEVPKADEAIDKLINYLKQNKEFVPTSHLEEDLKRLQELALKRTMWGSGKYTIKDLEDLKTIIDKHRNIYVDSTWVIRNTEDAEAWHITRKAIKEYIEDVAKKNWFADVKMLNNTIQTAYELANWVWEKWLKNAVASVWDNIVAYWTAAWTLWLGYWVLKDLSEWDVEWALIKWWWLVLLRNTYIKTRLWSLLQRLWWVSKSEALQWIDSGWKTALSESTSKEIAEIIRQDQKLSNKIKELWKQYIARVPKDASTVLWQKWLEEIIDATKE